MNVPTNTLTNAALDWAVLVALWGQHEASNPEHVGHFMELRAGHLLHQQAHFSTNWAHGGPIIELERIDLEFCGEWHAMRPGEPRFTSGFGPTPLVAAMRCYVASKLGDEVDVPEEFARC